MKTKPRVPPLPGRASRDFACQRVGGHQILLRRLSLGSKITLSARESGKCRFNAFALTRMGSLWGAVTQVPTRKESCLGPRWLVTLCAVCFVPDKFDARCQTALKLRRCLEESVPNRAITGCRVAPKARNFGERSPGEQIGFAYGTLRSETRIEVRQDP